MNNFRDTGLSFAFRVGLTSFNNKNSATFYVNMLFS